MNIKWSDSLRKIFTVMLAIILIFFVSGCAKHKGEFAFKNFFEDQYKKMDDPLEFEKNEKINWLYIFKDVRSVQNITITLLKKEIVWVDISNKSEQISALNNVIYGKIENLSDGNYRIIISLLNKVIDQCEFVIYSENQE
jgi:hypothetical protein